MADKILIEQSSGNVFADLEFDEPDVELAKARLSSKIAEEIETRGLTQRQAGEILGIDQPRVSLLVRGKTGQFSLERIIELLGRLSFDVRIEATPSPTRSRGRMLVTG